MGFAGGAAIRWVEFANAALAEVLVEDEKVAEHHALGLANSLFGVEIYKTVRAIDPGGFDIV